MTSIALDRPPSTTGQTSPYVGSPVADRDPRITDGATPNQTLVASAQFSGPVEATVKSNASSVTPVRVNAALSAQVYDSQKPGDGVFVPMPGHWRVATDSELARFGLSNAILHSGSGEFRARGYIDGTTGKLVIAFRGTNLDLANGKGFKDIAADVNQEHGIYSKYYANAIDIGERVAKSGYHSQVQFTGHSLGGGLAAAAALASGTRADTFNAPGLSLSTKVIAGHVNDRLNMPDGKVDNYSVDGQFLNYVGTRADNTHRLPAVPPAESSQWSPVDWARHYAMDGFENHMMDYVDRGLIRSGY